MPVEEDKALLQQIIADARRRLEQSMKSSAEAHREIWSAREKAINAAMGLNGPAASLEIHHTEIRRDIFGDRMQEEVDSALEYRELVTMYNSPGFQRGGFDGLPSIEITPGCEYYQHKSWADVGNVRVVMKSQIGFGDPANYWVLDSRPDGVSLHVAKEEDLHGLAD